LDNIKVQEFEAIEEQVSKEDEESHMKSSIKSNFSDGIRIP
jgi:hypothetical protein